MLPQGDRVQKISIIPRSVAALGYTLRRPTEDRYLMTRTELENKLAVLLGGRACPHRPDPFYAVALHYRVFDQTSDEEVERLLRKQREHASRATSTRRGISP